MLAGKDVVLPATASAFGSAAIANTIAYGPEAGLKAGVFAAAFAFVGGSEAFGELKKVTAERVIAHAVLGCVQQASSGGQCGPGAAAAAFGKIATGLTQGLGGGAQFAVTTVVGGTVSVIGGGKFANGAAQAGFGYLFNHCSSPNNCNWREKIATWFEGAWSVAEGTGNSLRFLARGLGLMGQEELARFNQEGAEVDKFVKRYNEDAEFRRDVNKALAQRMGELNTEEMKWRLNGRAAIGIVTGLGPAALIGDTTRAIENGHNLVDALMKGGLPGLPEKRP
jgi:hypothetical protein